MNYDLVPVVGSLSFFICPTYYTYTHTRALLYLDIYCILCAVYTDGAMAVSTKRDLRNTLWRKNSPALHRNNGFVRFYPEAVFDVNYSCIEYMRVYITQ